MLADDFAFVSVVAVVVAGGAVVAVNEGAVAFDSVFEVAAVQVAVVELDFGAANVVVDVSATVVTVAIAIGFAAVDASAAVPAVVANVTEAGVASLLVPAVVTVEFAIADFVFEGLVDLLSFLWSLPTVVT